MTSYIVHVYNKSKKLATPIPKDYEIGLLSINYKYKNLDKKPVNEASYVYKSSYNGPHHRYKGYYKGTAQPPDIVRVSPERGSSVEVYDNKLVVFTGLKQLEKTHFDLICNELEPSSISGSVLRNVIIHPAVFDCIYAEFRSVEYRKLINTNSDFLSFQWPNSIKIISFSLHCRQYDS